MIASFRWPERELAHPDREAAARPGREPASPGAALSRELGAPVEGVLAERPEWWWFDPALPLRDIKAGWPSWASGARADTGEGVAEFRAIVADYLDFMEGGAVFPPLLVMRLRPPEDRKALKLLPLAAEAWGLARAGHARNMPGAALLSGLPLIYWICNGRHRAVAAAAMGRAAHPAFVIEWLDYYRAARSDDGSARAWLDRAVAAAAERGRQGQAP